MKIYVESHCSKCGEWKLVSVDINKSINIQTCERCGEILTKVIIKRILEE